jgi:hypothetical protein
MPLKTNELAELRKQIASRGKYNPGVSIGIELAASFESFSSAPYYATKHEESKGIATIGIGQCFHVNGTPVSFSDKPVSLSQGVSDFLDVIDQRLKFIRSKVTSSTTDEQLGALLSFCYQAGYGNFQKSQLLAFHNQSEHNKASEEFLSKTWTSQNKVELPGLVKRRKEEKALYDRK